MMPQIACIFCDFDQARDVVGVRPQTPGTASATGQSQDKINPIRRLESTGETIQTLPRGSLSQMATWSIM